MAKNDKQHKLFGLIGKNISYSFSRAHFSKKFKQEGLENHQYVNFDLQDISVFTELIKEHQVTGFNVTIPYKETIIPYLHKLNKKAKKIGAVNTIKVTKKKKLIGYNTDEYGFW
ncbi:MAG: shikimate dehydrogenase, partial [Flavobacteriaceae bacterium]|nr:shikimate dehydrogenase [Flavobacteriaceae bacterium]